MNATMAASRRTGTTVHADLEIPVVGDLRAFVARSTPAAIPHEEDDQRRLDDHEHRAGDYEDQPVGVANALSVLGSRCNRREAAVAGEGGGCVGESSERSGESDQAHGTIL